MLSKTICNRLLKAVINTSRFYKWVTNNIGYYCCGYDEQLRNQIWLRWLKFKFHGCNYM